VHQASRLVNDLVLEPASHSLLRPAEAPVSFKRRLGRILWSPELWDERHRYPRLVKDLIPPIVSIPCQIERSHFCSVRKLNKRMVHDWSVSDGDDGLAAGHGGRLCDAVLKAVRNGLARLKLGARVGEILSFGALGLEERGVVLDMIFEVPAMHEERDELILGGDRVGRGRTRVQQLPNHAFVLRGVASKRLARARRALGHGLGEFGLTTQRLSCRRWLAAAPVERTCVLTTRVYLSSS
jgi:hypothetical protein